MHLLVLGGTQFVGRHVVEAALARGHDLTLFNRGLTNSELFPELEKLRGDRGRDLGALAGRSFDAVVDTSGFVPRIVRETIDALGDAGHYTFVSTMSVYAEDGRAHGEGAPVAQLEEETEEVDLASYGPLKALCEDVVRDRTTAAFIPRPGLIVGPWDPTGRFTYWPERVAAGGTVVAPAPPDQPVQVIDARDLADWIVDARQAGPDRDVQRDLAVVPARRSARDLQARRGERRRARLGRRPVPPHARRRPVDGAAALGGAGGGRLHACARRPRTG